MRAACRFGIAAFMAVAAACESNAPNGGVDACETIAPFKVDSSTTGRLESADCSVSGYLTDLYAVTLGVQTSLSVLMQSDSFDTYLELFGDGGEFLAVNDDSALGTVPNSFIAAILPAGSYVIASSSFNAGVRGPYALTTATRPQGIVGCQPVWITRGVAFTDSITGNDCAQTNGSRADLVIIPLLQGSVLTMNQRSTAVDARLEVRNFDQTSVLAFNDDSSTTNTNASLAFTALQSALYVIAIGTETAGETGTYTFEVLTTSTQAAPARPPKGLPLRVGPR